MRKIRVTQMASGHGRKPGQKPALDRQEIADIIAFLKTLSDGYVPAGKGEKARLAGR